MQIRYALSVLTLTLFVLGACGGQETPTAATVAPTAMAEPTTEEANADSAAPTEDASTGAAPMEGGEEAAEGESVAEAAPTVEPLAEPTAEIVAVERPAWHLLPMTNAQTGESFTLADFAGKTVYVEPFATWCTNCRQQLNYVNQARANFGEDVVLMALSVEPNIGNEALALYATEQGFEMIFAAMSPDLLREVVALYGQTITNPPATPHFIIRADGSSTELFTGIEGPEAITTLIQAQQE